MDTYFGMVRASRIGFEMSFTIIPKVDYLRWSFLHFGNDFASQASVEYHPDTNTLKYVDGDEIYQALAVCRLAEFDYSWNTVKVVVDLDTLEYVRLILNEREIDMSGLNFYRWGVPGVANRDSVDIMVMAGDDNCGPIYADRVILTQNEP